MRVLVQELFQCSLAEILVIYTMLTESHTRVRWELNDNLTPPPFPSLSTGVSLAGAAGTESLAGAARLAQHSQKSGWPLCKSHLSPPNLHSPTLPVHFLSSAALGKAFKHQGEIPRVSQTASLIQARPPDCTFAKTQT